MEEMAMALEVSLQNSGWHLKPNSVLGILHQLVDHPSTPSHRFQEVVLAHLLDTDLKDCGARCLPDASSLPRVTRLHGPLVLQVVSVRNICESKSKSVLIGHQQQGRLLRIGLTDGCTVVSAIEYQSMPAFSVNTAPGTKVKLEKTISVQNGILLGDAHSITLLGGHVDALHESWEIERKFSGLARATLKSPRVEGDSGPPPFHGLSVAKQGRQDAEKHSSLVRPRQESNLHTKDEQGPRTSDVSVPSTISSLVHPSKANFQAKARFAAESSSAWDTENDLSRVKPGYEPYRPRSMITPVFDDSSVELGNEWSIDMLPKSRLSPKSTEASTSSHNESTEKLKEDSSSSPLESGEKELNGHTGVPSEGNISDARADAIRAAIAQGVETAPLQNRVAAQKLLDKMADSNPRGFTGRGRGMVSTRGNQRREQRRGRGGFDDEKDVLTLDEWESRKGSNSQASNTDGDAALAQMLQDQLNIGIREGVSIRTAHDEAEQIRLSMFNFAVDRGVNERDGERRRGRGRGRGRRRGY